MIAKAAKQISRLVFQRVPIASRAFVVQNLPNSHEIFSTNVDISTASAHRYRRTDLSRRITTTEHKLILDKRVLDNNERDDKLVYTDFTLRNIVNVAYTVIIASSK